MTSSHLLALFCATTGKNCEDLGVDEEQIVLLVYLLFDVSNNKVIALQHHYVKPQPNEISETILTDDCKTQTGLEEEIIKNSQPLEHVLDELERFLSAKGVHPDHGGKSFTICTDGQAHLRQCLHPETSKKNITLPKYMHSFYDLRKEFKRFYKTEAGNIKNMLEFLGLKADQSVEYGVRQCQEIASILHRMVASGHIFVSPEHVKDRLEPGICSKNDRVDDNSVVRARGLPWQSSDQDIARFFKGLNIMRGGVALCLSQQGRRNGEALIWFESEEHRDLALKRHKHHIGQRYIEVYKATGKDFVNVAGGSNLEAQAFLSRGGQVIIRMRGLPFTATLQQVLEFFSREPNGCQVLDGEDGILFVYYPDGRSTGDAFVLFASEDEANKALKKHREIMGTRYIELFKSTMAEVQQVLNRSMDPRNPEQQETALPPLIAQLPPHHTSVPILPQNIITSGCKRDCIRLRNLPIGAQVTDILAFLAEYSQYIVYQGVHMVYGSNGELSGEAFIQMNSEESAHLTALNKHKKHMIFANKKRIIDVIQCSGEDMSLVLASGVPAIIPPHTPILPRQMIAPHGATIIPTTTALAGSLPYNQIPQPVHTYPSPLTHISARPPPYYQPILYWYPSPPVSPQTYYAQSGPSVVVMRGLPYNSSVQDIVNFFQGFPENPQRALQVSPECVQIQQNNDGRPNGDALVTFASRCEAERAITERNRHNIGSRYIELFMA